MMSKPMNILLAEDDPNIVKIATMVLTKVGNHTVEVATNGQDALDKALAGNYDLLLLDGMMPKMQGIDVCKNYYDSKKPPWANVIFLSAKSAQEDVKEFVNFGTGFIQKPFAPEKLCLQIEEILKAVS